MTPAERCAKKAEELLTDDLTETGGLSYLELRDKITQALLAELNEQARIAGMGAESGLKWRAECEQRSKRNLELVQEVDQLRAENEKLGQDIGIAQGHLDASCVDLAIAVLKGVISVADRATSEFDRARAALEALNAQIGEG